MTYFIILFGCYPLVIAMLIPVLRKRGVLPNEILALAGLIAIPITLLVTTIVTMIVWLRMSIHA